MIASLRTRELIDREVVGGSPCLLMHRSLQRSVLHRLDEDPKILQATFDMSVTLVRKGFPRQSPIQFPQNDIWEKCEKYSSHVMSLMTVYDASAQPPEPSVDFAQVLSDTSNYFWERNIFGDGLRASNTAERVCGKFGDKYKKQRADIHTVAASIRGNYGISERAGTLHRYQKAVALRQGYLNEMEPSDATVDDIFNYANAWGNMSNVMLDYECYEDCILHADLGINIKNKLLGDGYESIV